MVINNIIAKANCVANRVLGERLYSKVFGYRNIPEYKMLRSRLIHIKNVAKKTFKYEAKWLRISCNGILRVELAFLEDKYTEYLDMIEAFRKRLDDVIKAKFEVAAANNASVWINILRSSADRLFEIVCDHLASLEARIDALDAYEQAAADTYSMTFTETSSSSSLTDVTPMMDSCEEFSSLTTIASDSSLSIASATSSGTFEPLFVCRKVDVDRPVFEVHLIDLVPTAQCC